MTTWNDADPPLLPRAALHRRMLGGLRAASMVAGTMVLFGPYVLGMWIARMGGPNLHHRVQWLWARMGLFLCGLSLRVEGQRMAHGGALVANHASWLDIFALLGPGRINYVAKAEVRHWPVIGFIADVCGTMFVERRPAAAKRQQREMFDRIKAGQLLCFFPEGTSTDSLRVLPFKSSLFGVFMSEELRESVWVQPVTVVYEPPAGKPPSLYGWWGDMPFGKNIWDVATHSFGGRVTLVFHTPCRAADFTDRKALAQSCGDAVAAGMAEWRWRHLRL
ncbi:MAG: lysophospholipid acyltransferase family protein [Pseudomonadota bacterium]